MKTMTFSALLASSKSFFRWLEMQNYLLILGVPFVLIIPRAILAGDNLIGDESTFYEPIKTFGLNALSVIENTKNLRIPQGPGFFAVYGFFGSFVDYSLPALRLLNIFVSYLAALILFKILCKLSNFPIILTLWFVLNPYFLLLTTPYIYTDNLCLFFLISGTYFFIVKDQRLVFIFQGESTRTLSSGLWKPLDISIKP